MTVMLHPNKENPERYRVLDKELGIQEYFSFTKYGRKKAKKLADERQAEIDKRKNAMSLRAELGINKIFAQDGSVRGLRRRIRNRENRKEQVLLSLQVTVAPNVHKSKEISLGNRTFEEAYALVQQTLIEWHDLEMTYEIKQGFIKAKRLYW